MARRFSTPPPKQTASLTVEEKRAAIVLLHRRLEDLRKFNVNSIRSINDPQIKAMSDRIDTALVQIFGAETLDYGRYKWAAHLRSGGMFLGRGPSIEAVQQEVEEGRQKAIATLEEIILRFNEELELAPPESEPRPQATRTGAESSRVFVVHGHEDGPREAVARFLQKIDFEPIILHEQANRGRTVIEKVEAHGDVIFAVVLLTPDDDGCLRGETAQPRPRQNVLLELGYFIGRLGRDHVCALKIGEMELPSDFGGVVWVPFDAATGGWKLVLARELRDLGFDVDGNKVVP